VFEVKVAAARADDRVDVRGPCHVNYCEFLGNADPGYECQIPVQWRDGRHAEHGRHVNDNFWNQQGNGLARTALVVATEEVPS
jgi:hypothetical protein